MPEFSSQFDTMKDYNELFQCRIFNSAVAADIEFTEKTHFAIVNFQGWMYCPIPMCTAMEFVMRFGSHIIQHNGCTSVIFCRWEALSNDTSISPPAGIPQGGQDDEVVHGYLEIQKKIHQSCYTLYDCQKFDWNGFPDYGPIKSSPDNSSHPGRSGNLTNKHPPRSWIEAMSWDMTPTSHSSSSGGADHDHNCPQSSIRASPYPRPHSQSPSHRRAYQCCADSPLTSWEQFVCQLHSHSNITGPSMMWCMPIGPAWNLDFLEEGVILFPDNRTQIQLHYWVICDLAILNIRHILELAMNRGMKLILAIPYDALPHFHVSEPLSMMDLTKRTYDMGFQESPLTYDKGCVAFMDQYLGKLADILWHPHARAVVAMGGPTSWITRYYSGECLIKEFVSGPSIQVTVHHRGGITNAAFLDMPVFYDQLSAQEVELIHSYVPLGSTTEDRWVFPTTEILEDFSKHWRGEWNLGCERIMGNITRDLGSGLLAPQTRKEWHEYLRSNNRGEYTPELGSVPLSSDFTLIENKINAAFPVHWHGCHLRDITLPDKFKPAASAN